MKKNYNKYHQRIIEIFQKKKKMKMEIMLTLKIKTCHTEIKKEEENLRRTITIFTIITFFLVNDSVANGRVLTMLSYIN